MIEESLMPSDEDIRQILAEVAKHNPMQLPKTMLQLYFGKMIAQEFAKYTAIYNEAADEFNRKFNKW